MSADPPFTDEHETLRDSIRRFVANELRPHAAEWEHARWFPDEVFAKLAAVEFLGLKYPRERPTSPTACARASTSPRSRRPPRAGTTA